VEKGFFLSSTFVSILHCMTQRIYIFLWLKQEGRESITKMNQEKKRKKNEKEKRKKRKRRDKPVHFSWHWLTCSYTIVEWGQSGKISHPLHGRTECQASERGRRVSIWETREIKKLHFFFDREWDEVLGREEKKVIC